MAGREHLGELEQIVLLAVLRLGVAPRRRCRRASEQIPVEPRPEAASKILESVLFGVSRIDPIAFIGAPLVLLGVAAAASLVPTREAMRVDPLTILRYE